MKKIAKREYDYYRSVGAKVKKAKNSYYLCKR